VRSSAWYRVSGVGTQQLLSGPTRLPA
jgi:hypothetical protein